MAVDALSIWVGRAIHQGLITGLATHNKEGDIAILQYVDETILLLQDDLGQARNLKFLLCLFELMSGLKINFNKGEVIGIRIGKQRVELFEETFTCAKGELPLKYLGIPLDEKRLKNSDWDPSVVKMENRMACSLGTLLNIVGRSTLANSSLYLAFVHDVL